MEKWLELPDLPSEDEEPIPPKQPKTEPNTSHANPTQIRAGSFPSGSSQYGHPTNHERMNSMYPNTAQPNGPSRPSLPMGTHPSMGNMVQPNTMGPGGNMGPANFRQPNFPQPSQNNCRPQLTHFLESKIPGNVQKRNFHPAHNPQLMVCARS